jgi:hypothetical protein
VRVFEPGGLQLLYGGRVFQPQDANTVAVTVRGVFGQVAALQEWRDDAGALVAQLLAAVPAPDTPGFIIKQRVLVDGGLSTPTMFSVKGANPFIRMFADVGSPTGDTEGRIGIDDSNSMSFYAGTQATQHGIIRFVGGVSASDLTFHAVSDPATKNHMIHYSANTYIYRAAGGGDNLHFGAGGGEPLVIVPLAVSVGAGVSLSLGGELNALSGLAGVSGQVLTSQGDATIPVWADAPATILSYMI